MEQKSLRYRHLPFYIMQKYATKRKVRSHPILRELEKKKLKSANEISKTLLQKTLTVTFEKEPPWRTGRLPATVNHGRTGGPATITVNRLTVADTLT